MSRPSNPQIRSRLLALGADLVRGQGFSATGVQEITAAAGVPKGSFYNYFESKEAFAKEILEWYWASIVDAYGPILQDGSIPALVRIDRYFSALADFHQASGFTVGCLVANLALEVTSNSEEVRVKLLSIFDAWTTDVAICLNDAQSQGELPVDRDTVQLAQVLIEAFEGAVMRAKIEHDRTAFRRFSALILPNMLK
jgi:TetR/AcrR family transcriptional repressor of nem operon